MNIAEQKTALRQQVRAKRKAIVPEARRELEAALEDRLLNLPAFKHAKCIAAYNPIGSEARYVSNIDKLFMLDAHPTIVFPIVASQTGMHMVAFDMNDDRSVLANPLAITTGIDQSRIVDPGDIDLILVPGIAFDKHGHRMGQGGGYYDRYLPYISSSCLTVGIAFDEQVTDEIPHEPHDYAVSYVVTPSRVITAEK